jgi:hypothetical protein
MDVKVDTHDFVLGKDVVDLKKTWTKKQQVGSRTGPGARR